MTGLWWFNALIYGLSLILSLLQRNKNRALSGCNGAFPNLITHLRLKRPLFPAVTVAPNAVHSQAEKYILYRKTV